MNFKKENIEILKICQVCSWFKYNGNWHLKKPAGLEGKNPKEKVPVRFQKCPHCATAELFSQYSSTFSG